MEGYCTHNPEDWNNKSIKWKCRETFKGCHTALTKQLWYEWHGSIGVLNHDDRCAHLVIKAFKIYWKPGLIIKVSKGAKIRIRYNKVPHLTQDTNGKATNSQLDTTHESQEVSPFPAGDHKAYINRHAQSNSNHRTEKKHKRSTKEIPPCNGQ